MSESDEDVPKLSSATLAALKEFYQEKEDEEKKFNTISVESETTNSITFGENWVSW